LPLGKNPQDVWIFLGGSPNAAEEEFRRIGMADFFLRGDTLPVGDILGLLAEHLDSLWGGPNPVSTTLRERGNALYLE